MGVNIGGGGESRVSQPILNLLHWNALAEQKTGTAVSEVMKSYRTELMLPQQKLEMIGNIVGTKEHSHFVYANIVLEVLTVPDIPAAFSAD